MGKLKKYEVIFPHPRVFQVGERITAHVALKLSEPMKMKCITVNVIGKAKVHWQKTKYSGNRTHTVHYRAEEVYFNERIVVYGSPTGESIMHPEGMHKHQFTFQLPHSLPSSFEGAHGYVRYWAKACMDRPWKFNHDTKSAFTVISPLDLNAQSPALRSAMQGEQNTEVSCCCCISGKVHAKFRINKRGYVPGEPIYISAEIHNNSNTTVTGSSVTLKQHIEFMGRSDAFFSSGSLKSNNVTSAVATKSHGSVAAGQSDRWDNEPLFVPSLPPSKLEHCSIINISYAVKFYVTCNYGEDIKLACELTIGTVPLLDNMGGVAGAVISQPVSAGGLPPPIGFPALEPPPAEEPAKPPAYSDMPPPSYEECVQGRVNINEDDDSQYTHGQLSYAPVYPYYTSLAGLPPTSPPAYEVTAI